MVDITSDDSQELKITNEYYASNPVYLTIHQAEFKIFLKEYAENKEKRNQWKSPLVALISVLLAFISYCFNYSDSIFYLIGFGIILTLLGICIFWTGFSLFHRFNSKIINADDIIDKIKG